MKNCSRCGTSNDDEAYVCSLCGEPFVQDVDMAPAETGETWNGTEDAGYCEGGGYRYDEENVYQYGYAPQDDTPQYEIQRKRRVRSILIRVGAVLTVMFLVVLTVLAYRFFRRLPDPVPSADKPAAIDVMSEPVQSSAENVGPFHNNLNKSTAVPVASYTISAKVLDVIINIGYGKEGAMPIDIALVWGRVAESDYNKYLKYGFDNIWKHNQWLQVQLKNSTLPEGMGEGYLMTHISNNHIFPANENIFNAVAHLKKGEEVQLSGYLVNVTDSEGGRYTTSTSRTDIEAGACECFYVNRVQYGGKVYR